MFYRRVLFSKLREGVKVLYSPKYLFLTNTATAMGILTFGDALQQSISIHFHKQLGKEKHYNFRRTVRACLTGIVLGPMNHFWYKMLDFYYPGRTIAQVVPKVLIDILSCPAFSCAFVTTVSILEGKSPLCGLREYRSKFYVIFALDMCVWPPAQLLNFCLLPPATRVIYICSVNLFYNTVLTYIKHEHKTHQQTEQS